MGPEIASSRRFAKMVLESHRFRRMRISVVIDEVHVVDQWSTFRKEYGKLSHFRSRLPASTSMLGCSATLDPHTYQSVVVKAGFNSPAFINTVIDRPEIYLEILGVDGIQHSHEALHFLFPDKLTWKKAQKLDKTIVFFDSKQSIRPALKVARDWLVGAGLTMLQARTFVRGYYACLREKEKREIRDDFRRKNSSCRICFVTEAMGMGVELEAVTTVVQYGSDAILKDISMFKSLVQRLGRCARGPGEQGHFIWLVKPWLFCHQTKLQYAVRPQHSSRLQNSMTIDQHTGEIDFKKSDVENWTKMHI
jgi:ATP-dependent DNA helicase RecQ